MFDAFGSAASDALRLNPGELLTPIPLAMLGVLVLLLFAELPDIIGDHWRRRH